MNLLKKIFKKQEKQGKIEMIDIDKIWYILSTIESSFPNLSNNPSFVDFRIQLHGDDWLQQEFISSENAQEADNLIERIKDSAADCKEDSFGNNKVTFYRKCFARKMGPDKITRKIYLDDLKKSFDNEKIGTLSFSNFAGYAENTFAAAFAGTFIYGQLVDDGSVVSLGIVDVGDITDIERLRDFAHKYQLNFVDWLGYYQIKQPQ